MTRKPAPTKRAPSGRPRPASTLRIAVAPDPAAHHASALRLREYVGDVADRLARGEVLDDEARVLAVKVLRTFAASPIGKARRSRGRPPTFDPGTVALEIAAAVILQRVPKTRAVSDAAARYGRTEEAIEKGIRGQYAAAVALVKPSAPAVRAGGRTKRKKSAD